MSEKELTKLTGYFTSCLVNNSTDTPCQYYYAKDVDEELSKYKFSLTTLRADLQRVTAERDEYKQLREWKLTDEQIEEAIKRRATHCKHVDHGQKICVGCALIAIKYEIERNEAAALAAVKPETCEACGGSGVDSVVEYRDGTQEELACSACNGTGHSVEQKEV
jgi:hypothetical protein